MERTRSSTSTTSNSLATVSSSRWSTDAAAGPHEVATTSLALWLLEGWHDRVNTARAQATLRGAEKRVRRRVEKTAGPDDKQARSLRWYAREVFLGMAY